MSPDFSPDLRRELLDDFYAECDELLGGARAALGLLESKPESAQTSLETVFRQVHSLKGISSIVGLRAAEQMAHGMEEILRHLSKREIALTAAAMDALLEATQRFEQIVSSHRQGRESPPIADALEALRALAKSVRAAPPAESAPVEPAAEPKRDPVADLRARGLRAWRCSFAPSPALEQRGVTVTSVRTCLGEIGEIVSATPTVLEKGGIVFDFVVGLRGAPPDLPALARDGMKFRAITEKEEAAAVPGSAPANPPPESLSLTPSHIVRVDLSRLDDLMRIAGEMVIHRSRLEERIRRYGNDAALKETNHAFARSLRELREGISRVRLVPIDEIFAGMPLVVRQLARNSPKKARVALEGQQTPIDKYLVERLREPLLHLVRNAFSHGIESPEEREAAGKPAEGTILLHATSVAESAVIRVRDDGRGIKPSLIAARAAALGLAVPETLDAGGLLEILCMPGFSTREEADFAAGRGVGMAIVASTLRELGGTIALGSGPGPGTEFTLRLPLTLSIVEAIIVTVGDEICAVPQGAIAEIVRVPGGEIRTVGATEVVPYRGGLLPVVRLREIFRLPAAEKKSLTLLVLESERGSAGLAVDGVRTRREVVVRPLVDPLVRVPGVSGATELGDGRPILILDPAAMTRGVVRPPSADDLAADPAASASRRP